MKLNLAKLHWVRVLQRGKKYLSLNNDRVLKDGLAARLLREICNGVCLIKCLVTLREINGEADQNSKAILRIFFVCPARKNEIF